MKKNNIIPVLARFQSSCIFKDCTVTAYHLPVQRRDDALPAVRHLGRVRLVLAFRRRRRGGGAALAGVGRLKKRRGKEFPDQSKLIAQDLREHNQ